MFKKYKLECQKEVCDVAMIMTNLSSTNQDRVTTNNVQNASPNDTIAASIQLKGGCPKDTTDAKKNT